MRNATDSRQAPANFSTRIEPSGPCSTGPIVRNRFSFREWTPEEIERDRQREAEQKLREAEDERERRCRMFHEYLNGRSAYADCSLKSWRFSEDAVIAARQRTVTEAIREFCQTVDDKFKAGTGVLLYGSVGCGKDRLATEIVRWAVLKHGHTAKFLNGVDWYGQLRDAMSDDCGKSESNLIREASGPNWLHIADPLPPSGSLSQYQSSMLYRLVDERATRGLPTIVTLNVSGGTEAVERLGAATWDRIKGGAWCIPCNWPSHRTPARIV